MRPAPTEKPPFEELYEEYVARIYAYARAQLKNSAEAEDVTADVFIKAYEAYPRYEPRQTSPGSWLFQIARNAIVDHFRRSARQDRLRQTVARQPQPLLDPSQLAEESLRLERIMGALQVLGERQRNALSLRHLGLSFSEVGEVLGCSEDAAKMLYHRALRTLRGRIEEER